MDKQPVIVFSKDSSQAYILMSLMQVRTSFIVRTRLSVTDTARLLNPPISLAIENYSAHIQTDRENTKYY